MVLPSPNHGLRAILEACASQAAIKLEPSIETDSLSAMIDLVRHGFGPTVLPLAPIFQLIKDGVLAAAPLIDPVPARTIVLAYPADRRLGLGARYIANSFVNIVSDLVEAEIWVGKMLV